MTTPILIVALPRSGEPFIWWSTADYVIAAVSALHDLSPTLDDAWPAYAALHETAYWFRSHAEAMDWAATYDGSDWLRVRAAVARTEPNAPQDLLEMTDR